MPVTTEYLQEENEELKSRVEQLSQRLAAITPDSLDAWLEAKPPLTMADMYGILGVKLSMSLEEIRRFEFGYEADESDDDSGAYK